MSTVLALVGLSAASSLYIGVLGLVLVDVMVDAVVDEVLDVYRCEVCEYQVVCVWVCEY